MEMPQIELKRLDSLVAYSRNARTHSDEQVAQLKSLILEFGWTNAVLVDGLGIIAGHGRCLAAGEIYKTGGTIKFPNGADIPVGMVPTIDCSGWSDAQRRAYILADNKSAMNAGWIRATTAAKWRDDGQSDPHSSIYDCERGELAMGHLTDDQLANECYLYNHRGGLQSMAYLTAMKERIRWLSRKLLDSGV